MTLQNAKLIEILDRQSGKLKESIISMDENAPSRLEELAPYPRGKYNEQTIDPLKYDQPLTEAATGGVSTDNFPDMLRMGVQFDVFTGFNAMQTTYEQIVKTVPSRKQQEEYQDDEGIGLAPVVLEGQEYPEVSPTLGGGKIIPNYKRGFLIHVTEESQRFDNIGWVRALAEKSGRALRLTREQAVMNILTDTNKYNVKNNNDQAANNTQNLTFSPVNFNTALALMMTQKDVRSGQYLGVVPNLLVVCPLLERFAKMLLLSADLARVGGSATNDVYGGGTNNPFFGTINRIIVSPLFGASYQWALLDTSRAIYFQEVEGPSVQIEGANMASESWLRRDTIRYKARDWWGTDMRDDRYAFYSSSTSAPTAA